MKKYINLTVILSFIGVILYTFLKPDSLDKNGKIVTGTVLGTKVIKGLYITYNYKVNNNVYEAVSSSRDISSQDIRKYLVGRSFIVIYDSTDTFKSSLLIFKSDFKAYNISYPDSLKWVCDSLKLDKCR